MASKTTVTDEGGWAFSGSSAFGKDGFPLTPTILPLLTGGVGKSHNMPRFSGCHWGYGIRVSAGAHRQSTRFVCLRRQDKQNGPARPVLLFRRSDSPAQRRGVHRRVPQRQRVGIGRGHGDRAARHFERGHVTTGEVAHHFHAGTVQHFQCCVDHHVELQCWRAAEAVDEQDRLLAALERQVFQDRAGEFGRDLVGAGELDAAPARFAVDADAHFHLVCADLERGLAGGRNSA